MKNKKKNNRPLIGITIGSDDARSYANARMAYLDAVWQTGGQPLLLPHHHDADALERWVESLDGLLLTGGDDIHPLHYGSEPHPNLSVVDLERDAFELALCRRWLQSSKPLFGICRGLQLMNVALGGTLYQDISERAEASLQHRQQSRRQIPAHTVKVKPGTLLDKILKSARDGTSPSFDLPANSWAVNSIHHQIIRQLGRGLRVSATAPDGVIEAVELENHPFALSVQWHPEELVSTLPPQRALFAAFNEKARG